MTATEMITVLQAYLDGKQIQQRNSLLRIYNDNGGWEDVSYPDWNFLVVDYRIKPEKEKPKRMTNRQLAEWLSRGFGSWKTRRNPTVYMEISCPTFEENIPVPNDIIIRPWVSDDWIEPTVDIYEKDCKDWYRTASNKGE